MWLTGLSVGTKGRFNVNIYPVEVISISGRSYQTIDNKEIKMKTGLFHMYSEHKTEEQAINEYKNKINKELEIANELEKKIMERKEKLLNLLNEIN